jgi:Rad3-related DNA helicase
VITLKLLPIIVSSEQVHIADDPYAAVKGRNLSLWCFHSGVAMSDLISPGVRSTILASGTLSPMSSFAHEMGM